ncbi:MAG: PepSY domain-containing protein [Bacteroidales bacterium]|nr:PepSY domain-containing protein [Bacteroidales bacterium]
MKVEKKRINQLKKYHKWPGLIIALFLMYYAISGILMNHRETISGIDISRNILPKNYHYKNWNLAALRGSQIISSDSILVYGDIGIWLSDSTFQKYTDYNQGLPKGIDNRKIFDVYLSPNKNLFAATLFGLYAYNKDKRKWQKFDLNTKIDRFVSVISKEDSIIAMNRSYIFAGLDKGTATKFKKIQLKAPKGYKNKISLFETVWQIHSGEIFGLPGKLFVDFIGVISILISITGIIFFFFPKLIKYRKRKNKRISSIAKINRNSLKWHNKLGSWFLIFLIVISLTGMFLRPPLLLTIARANIPVIKFTHLDQPNAWYDDLRDIMYNETTDSFILAAYNGMYQLQSLEAIPEPYKIQPPISVMGINVFENINKHLYLIGSFSGLFLWNPQNPIIYDFISGHEYQENSSGRPFGKNAISGIITNNSQSYIVDYNQGVLNSNFSEMPQKIIKKAPISLWSLCLEIHTGRIFQFLLKDFYILIVPLSGIVSLIVIISGYLIYQRRRKNK